MSERQVYSPEAVMVAMIDVQRCFMPKEEGERIDAAGFGELPVASGEEVVPVLNRINAYAINNDIERITTQDWHPEETAHFGEGDMQWPVHAVAGSKGAELHPNLKAQYSHHGEPGAISYKKGQETISSPAEDDSYSGYNAIDGNGESLAEYAKKADKKVIIIGGLALGGAELNTCVDSTALDFAAKTDMEVVVVEDACRAIFPDEQGQIRQKLERAGVKVVQSGDLIEGKVIRIER